MLILKASRRSSRPSFCRCPPLPRSTLRSRRRTEASSPQTCTEAANAALCWRTEAVSPRKACKSRRRSWYTPDFARWPSTSAGAAHGPRSKSGDDGFEHDVLAAVRYLGATGAKTVAVVGASFGGEAAANASIEAEPGEIDRLVLLAAWTDRAPEKIKGRKLFIGARDDANDDGPRLPKIRANYEEAVGPKELIILDGSAHAQFLFATNQGERLMREMLRFLSQP